MKPERTDQAVPGAVQVTHSEKGLSAPGQGRGGERPAHRIASHAFKDPGEPGGRGLDLAVFQVHGSKGQAGGVGILVLDEDLLVNRNVGAFEVG